MRLGAYPAQARCPASIVREAYGEEVVYERHRHRYEVNNRYRARLEEAGHGVLGHVARRPAGRVRRAAARPPVLRRARRRTPSSRAGPNRPHPLFAAFVRAARERAEGRAPAPARSPIDRSPPAPIVDGGGPTFRVVPGRRATLAATPGSSPSTRLRVAGPDGEEFDRHVVHHPGAVVVVPVDDDGERRAARAPVPRRHRAATLLEVPAGKRDVEGEPPETTAAPRARGGDRLRAPVGSTSCASSTTRPASATSTRTCSSPPSSRSATRAAVSARRGGDDDRARPARPTSTT